MHIKHLNDVVKLNGTINKAYEAEYSEYVKEHQDDMEGIPQKITPANSSIGRTAAMEVDEILQRAVLSVEETRTVVNLKSPSPTKSFDEIVPESEVIDQLTEKKAGNGALYFTDEIRIADSEEDESVEDGDSTNAIAMLDDVLEDEESHEVRKISDMSSTIPHSHEAIATAVVHQENVEEEVKEVSDENNNQEVIPEKITEEPVTLHEKGNKELPNKDEEKLVLTATVDEDTKKLPEKEESKPVFAALKNQPDGNEDFITKLNTLLRQKSVPSRKLVPLEDDAKSNTTSLPKTPFKRPSLIHAQSEDTTSIEPSNVNTSIDKETGEHLDDLPTFNSSSTSNEETTEPNIPKAPVFDPELYKSLGRAKSSVVLKEVQKIDDDTQRLRSRKTKPPPSKEEKELSIKEKLEAIFKNTLPMRVQRSIEVPSSVEKPPEANVDKENSRPESPKQEEVQRASSFKTKAKKFDTVEKQKAIFANVIRELDPDKPRSLQSTPSFNRRQLTEVFKLDNSDSRRNSGKVRVENDAISDKTGEMSNQN